MGESLIDLVRQYPALWDKQNSKYKDSNFKDAKWREIAETLGVPKDDANQEMEITTRYICQAEKYQTKKW